MKRFMIVFLCLSTVHLWAVDKSRFDLSFPESLSKTSGLHTQGAGYGSQMLKGEIAEVTLVTGGYFTIGTYKGVDNSSSLDENCGVTFGHPFAMTSYPIVGIDGQWYKPDELVSDIKQLAPQKESGRLFMQADFQNGLEIEFSLRMSEAGRRIVLETVLKNNDDVPHQMDCGLVLDPALGKWGDGCLYVNEYAVERDTSILPVSAVDVWERKSDSALRTLPKAPGMGFSLQFEPVPGQILCRNWNDVVENPVPKVNSIPQILYDCVLQSTWSPGELAAGAQKTVTATLALLQPNFGNTLFLRWDLPRFLTTETSLLFPRQILSTVCAGNASASQFPDLTLEIESHRLLSSKSAESSFSLDAGGWAYVPVQLESGEIYDDQVVSVTARVTDRSGNLLDVLQHHVLIPAVPVSDTGLVVRVDSTFYDNDKINVIFNVEIEETGQKIYNLSKDQVFLYQNEQRIKDFTMEKYRGAGANLADIVFVLDCSGSMGDEIAQVRSNLSEFADSLVTRGYDFRIGVVTFSTTIDHVWDLSNNVDQMKANLASISLWGGIEDSPLALYRASELSFRLGSRRTIIWITDEPYPEHSYTKQQIVDRMLSMGITVHGVGTTDLQTDWFNPIVLSTGGNFYDINGNFRDIMLDVANMESQDLYHIAWTGSESISNHVRIKVHYAGLGGQVEFYTEPPAASNQPARLACFPNPFNPVIKIYMEAPDAARSQLFIYNLLGQCVRQFDLTLQIRKEILWDAKDELGRHVGAGPYFVQLVWQNAKGVRKQITRKILYVK